MEMPSWLDSEVIFSAPYWLLTGGAELALMIGFKLQSSWGAGATMPFLSKVLVLALVPVAAYILALKFRS